MLGEWAADRAHTLYNIVGGTNNVQFLEYNYINMDKISF